MDFVTITDHDTIAGALTVAHLPDTFVSEELTVWFKGEPQAVHVLCYGITPEDHEWLQAHNDDVEACAEYLHSREITAALAHPFYAGRGTPRPPPPAASRPAVSDLGDAETGPGPRKLNLPAFVYIETHGGTAIGGSDDHAGIDIGATFTETPYAATPEEFLAHVRAGTGGLARRSGQRREVDPRGDGPDRPALGRGEDGQRPDPAAVLKIVERVMSEGDVRHGQSAGDLGPEDARALLRAWLDAMGLDLDEANLIERLQAVSLSHPDLYRRARRIHERSSPRPSRMWSSRRRRAASTSIAACSSCSMRCIPAIPYAAAGAFLGRESSS